MQTKNDFLGLR